MNKEVISLNKKAVKIAIKKVRNAYTPDKILMQSVQALIEEEHCINVEYERLRELYWRYYPELLININDIYKLIKVILEKKEKPKESMGYDLSNDEINFIINYAKSVKEHLKVINLLEEFIKKQSLKIMPETSKIATPLLAAKLLTLAGGLKELAIMPSSTIQLLGAEKALFRHLRSGARPPKYGIILFHQSVQTAKNRGKAARQLANHIAISIKKDYFGVKK